MADVKGQLAEAHAAAQDSSAVDGLKSTIADLEQKLKDAETARAAAEEKSTTASDELVGKHSAEKAELEQKHQAAAAQVEELQTSLGSSDSAKAELEKVLGQLSASQEEVSQLKAKQEAASGEVEEAKSKAKATEEKLADGEKYLNDQIDKNMSLLNQLGEVDSAISASRKRVRELEAEVAALKSGAKGDGGGLESSRWAPEEVKEDAGPAATEGEDLGSSIEGTVGHPYSSGISVYHPFL